MKTYLKEFVNMHKVAFNLSYIESSILYNMLIVLTSEFNYYDESVEDIYIYDETLFELYASIMFKFMTTLINLRE